MRLMKTKSIGLGVLILALAAGCSGGSAGAGGSYTPSQPQPTASASQSPATPGAVLGTQNLDGGPAFVNAQGFAVYEFSGDGNDQSNCTGSCANVWPPVAPPNGVTLTSPWSSFKRSGGSAQLAYQGHPLYTFVGDTQPGEVTGNGVQGFSLARPAASGSSTPTPAPSPSSTPYHAP